MKQKTYLTSLLLCLAIHVFGQENKQVADSLYDAGRYEAAAQIYQSLLKKCDNAYLYYNLGNCFYRLHNINHAILNYERAVIRDPGNKDMRFNLTLARTKTADRLDDTDDFFIVYWARSVVNAHGADGWGRAAIVMFCVLLLSALGFLFLRPLRWRKVSFGAGITACVCVLLFNAFAYIQKKQRFDTSHAIVMTAIQVRSTPATSGNLLFMLHDGTKVAITDASMKLWCKISLPDGRTGWVERSKIEQI